jgi:N-acetylglutamate synthase/N-acetylornithine aminotransferase
MASTRDLVVYILNTNARIRQWCQDKHQFSLEKAEQAELDRYGDIVAEIIADGEKAGVVSRAQIEGTEPLPS